MAIVLVDIQVLTLEEINQRIAKCKRDIEVRLVKLSLYFFNCLLLAAQSSAYRVFHPTIHPSIHLKILSI